MTVRDETLRLVEQLAHPETRRAARQQLVRLRAVDALLGCLASGNESVAWAAVQSLAELRSREALPRLVELLDRGVLRMDVAAALRRISGEDFGADPARWKSWLAAHGPQGAHQPDKAAIVQQAGELLGAAPRRAADGYQLDLSQPDGRRQRVYLRFARAGDDDLAMVVSHCGPAHHKHYEALLRKNVSIPHGAFGVIDVDGAPTLVLVDTLLVEALTARELAASVENIAARADIVERGLAKEDAR